MDITSPVINWKTVGIFILAPGILGATVGALAFKNNRATAAILGFMLLAGAGAVTGILIKKDIFKTYKA